eukprot:4318172-Prymnesium_polylepis.1
MATACIVRKPPTRVCGGVPLGAPCRLSCAAAGVSSGLAGGEKAPGRLKSKLTLYPFKVKASILKIEAAKIEADTVPT